MKTSVLRSAAFFALASAALSAQAQNVATLTFTPATYTVFRPTSGTQFVNIFGTLTSTSSNEIGAISLTGPAFPLYFRYPPFSIISAAIASTGSFTGLLLQCEFDSSSALGTYEADFAFGFNSVGPDNFTSNYAHVTVNLVEAPAPPPAPGPTAALPFALMALKRRRRA